MAYKGSEVLAENKLILLFILSETGVPVSKNKITQVVLENNLMNYFTMQQLLGELVDSGLVTCYEHIGRHYYRLEIQGIEVLKMFYGRIPSELRSEILKYLLSKGEMIRSEDKAEASYATEDNNHYLVNLKLIQKHKTVLDAKLKVRSQNQAKKICHNWNGHAQDILEKITEILLDDFTG